MDSFPSTVTMSVQSAAELATRSLQSLGYDREQAGIVADHLVDAAMCGYGFAGLPRILAIAEERPRWPNPGEITVVRETPVSAMLDGAANIGYLVARRSADIAAEKAKASGVAVVGAFNTYFSGRCAYYVERIARQGLAAIHFTSAFPVVVPLGGLQPRLGTNPVSVAIPKAPDPFILDFATAATTHGDVLLSRTLNLPLDENVAVDAKGRPTRDPAAALEGGILPFGGHKGFGLSLAVQLFGLMAGADLGRGQLADTAFFFLAFDPGLLRSPDELGDVMKEYLDSVRSTPTVEGSPAIRIPSEAAYARREASKREGIEIDSKIIAQLERLAGTTVH